MLNKLRSFLKLHKVLNIRSVFLYLYLKNFKNNSGNSYHFKLRNNLHLLVTPLLGNLNPFYEIFVQEIYRPNISNGLREMNILDIGANVGYFSLYASKIFKNARIFSFEPYHNTLNVFNKQLEMNSIHNVKTYQQAVSDKSGKATLYVTEWSGCNTIIPNKFDEGYYSSIEVECINLERIFKITGVDTFDLAKIDCEGSEYQIILNTPDEQILKINEFVIEAHIDKNHTYTDLIKRFNDLGYESNYNENGILTARRH